ncbi:Seven transmembrane protein 1 [Smittium mucronatum]|uniref:Seven transmembrane protein 1 n=1 Tax=Smittium mucronatum TaxID=133383 RepID=A0A1R0H2J2_9FUNG|nr:Seven transmembrane protein 1 [Smittium mucronatum]
MSPAPISPFHHLLSQFFGYVSLLMSMIVTVPQIIENYNNKSGDSVSMTMLWIWMVADLLNFFGSVMQNIIFTAILQALYFVVTDGIIILQTYYYRFYYTDGKFNRLSADDVESAPQQTLISEGESSLDSVQPDSSLNKTSYGSIPSAQSPSGSGSVAQTFSMLRPLLITVAFFGLSALLYTYFPEKSDKITPSDYELQFWPQLFGYLSAILYAGSRIPQIIQNHRAKSCEGLSIMMFGFTLTSNIAYIISFFAESTDLDYIIPSLPWILGSAISPFLDLYIFYQFYIYS